MPNYGLCWGYGYKGIVGRCHYVKCIIRDRCIARCIVEKILGWDQEIRSKRILCFQCEQFGITIAISAGHFIINAYRCGGGYMQTIIKYCVGRLILNNVEEGGEVHRGKPLAGMLTTMGVNKELAGWETVTVAAWV